jgi:predicted ATPase
MRMSTTISASPEMKRFILTGAPGCGKTTILTAMAARGWAIVAEAATDVIAVAQAAGEAHPERGARFIDDIVALQRRRQSEWARQGKDIQLFDRSPICTWALALYLGHPISEALQAEVDRLEKDRIYERRVFFIDNLGFCEPTAARRISFEDSLVFDALHEETYRSFGYDCVKIPPVTLQERVGLIERLVQSP